MSNITTQKDCVKRWRPMTLRRSGKFFSGLENKNTWAAIEVDEPCGAA